jgi:RNA polymerase sigma-70 factor (ECF subfamily)
MPPTTAPSSLPVATTRGSRDTEFSAIALPLLPRITRIARAMARSRADGDDVVQETFLRAYRYWHTFDPGTDCAAWLMTICRRVLVDIRRRTSNVESVEDDELESLAAARLHKTAAAAGLERLFDRVDLGPAIQKAIGELADGHREVITLCDVEGFSYDEAALMLDVPIGTVRSRLYRGRRHLQQALIAFALDAGFTSVPRTESP